MSAGFVSFSDENFMPLAEVLVKSLRHFSKYQVELFCVNCDCPFESPNMISRRLDMDLGGRFGVVHAKPMACIQTQFDCGVLLDADNIANLNVDELIDMALNWKESYPLCCGHGCDPNNCGGLMEHFKVPEKTMPYVHANYIFNSSCKPFFQDCLDMIQSVIENNVVSPNGDESILNVALWKHGATRQIQSFNPWSGRFENYQNNSWPYHGSYYEKRGLTFHVFHGEKNLLQASEILSVLKGQDVFDFCSNQVRSRKLWINEGPWFNQNV